MTKSAIVYTVLISLLLHLPVKAQESRYYTHDLKDFDKAVALYRDKAYVSALDLFDRLAGHFDDTSERKADCMYYAAQCAIHLGLNGADDRMNDFVRQFPTSAKRNNAFAEVADYYFDTGKYSYALKWLKRIRAQNLPRDRYEDYLFKMGYSLFASKDYTGAKKYFVKLLDSPEYGSRAKYYYGYIAYSQDDYDNADKYLGEVSGDRQFGKEVSYYRADMYFKLGRFQDALNEALSLLNTARRTELSQINKIIGESYFNLEQYDKAIPYLKNYKGMRGKWTNTDYYRLGYCYYRRNDYETAVSYFNKIIDGDNAVAQNAYYHLGECYLHLDKKSEALNAFRNASQMDFDPGIRKDAFYNYAKLSYDIGNPYSSVPEVLQEYVRKYPSSGERKEIESLIISAYYLTKDYAGALQYLDKMPASSRDNTLYQKVAYYRALQLFDEKKYEEAAGIFDKALLHTPDEVLKAKSLYWKSECSYRSKQYDQAYRGFKEVRRIDAASGTREYLMAPYQAAYSLFKQKKYAGSIPEFEQFLNDYPPDGKYFPDALLRLGDVYFVTKNYGKAIARYEKAAEVHARNEDYAVFQTAICYGFTGQQAKKKQLLNKVINRYPGSLYRDDALYLLGTDYFDSGDTGNALNTFQRLLKEHPKSNLHARTMLKIALVYYNTGRNDQAIDTYHQIVNTYPNTSVARQAVKNARQIYIETGRVDEYAAWAKELDFVEINNAELDQDMYESADKLYNTNQFNKAVTAYQKYLKAFPKGMYALDARYYMAQCYEHTGKKTKALEQYEIIASSPANRYTEDALARLSEHYLDTEDWEKAGKALENLEKAATHEQNVLFARSNLMKVYYFKENYSKAVTYAGMVLEEAHDEKMLADAKIIIARAAMKTGDEDKARTFYAQVEQNATGERKAEALYYKAYFQHKDGKYTGSNQTVQHLAKEYAAYKYWGAKALVVMAKNFHALDDAYQATYILDSVIKNFPQYDDIIEEAQTLLAQIKKEQAKTNDSVNPE